MHSDMVDSIALENVQYINDLGITVSYNLSFGLHVSNIVKKAWSRLGLVKRCLGHGVNSMEEKICITALIRPLLEYGTSFWFACNKKICCNK